MISEQRDNRQAFVVASSRSGSTLLRYLLDTHPDLYCPPETHICEVTDRIFKAAVVLFPRDEALALAGGMPAEIMLRAAHRRGKAAWCDKSISSVNHLDLLRAAFPHAKFICLYRHALDVASSALDLMRTAKLEAYGFEPYIRESPGDLLAAVLTYWCDCVERALQFERDYPTRCLRVRYEDMVTRPSEIADEVFDFLDLDRQPNIVDRVFAVPHEMGPGDFNIVLSHDFDPSSVGAGRALRLKGITQSLAQRIDRLHDELGYPTLVSTLGVNLQTAPQSSDSRLADMLSRHIAAELAIPPGTIREQITIRCVAWDPPTDYERGPPSSSALIEIATTGHVAVRADDDPARAVDATVTATTPELLDLAGRRVNLRSAFRRGTVKLSGDPRAFKWMSALLG